MLRLGITRPANRLAELSRRAADRDIKIVPLSLTKLVPLPFEWPADLDPQKIDWLVFTSAYGVSSFFERLSQLDIRPSTDANIAVIGTKTEEAVSKLGLRSALMSDDGTGRRLFEQLASQSNLNSSSVVYARASIIVSDPETLLREAGVNYQAIICYESVSEEIDGKELEEMSDQDYILFTAPSNVTAFSDQFGRPIPRTIAIGTTTAGAMKEIGWQVSKIMNDANVDSILEYI